MCGKNPCPFFRVKSLISCFEASHGDLGEIWASHGASGYSKKVRRVGATRAKCPANDGDGYRAHLTHAERDHGEVTKGRRWKLARMMSMRQGGTCVHREYRSFRPFQGQIKGLHVGTFHADRLLRARLWKRVGTVQARSRPVFHKHWTSSRPHRLGGFVPEHDLVLAE
jgi:hypothetical protein